MQFARVQNCFGLFLIVVLIYQFTDIGTIWSRLFDHRGFLSGEISLILQEFEVISLFLVSEVMSLNKLFKFQKKRGDTEVDNLFKIIENITDIKDADIDRFKQAIDQIFPEANQNLKQAENICEQFSELEDKYKNVCI